MSEADLQWLRSSDRYIAMVKQIRETPLIARLQICQDRIGKMCSEHRPPKMTIPVQAMDDDFFINRTLEDAHDAIIAKPQPAPTDAQVEEWIRDVVEGLGLDNAVDRIRTAQHLRTALPLILGRGK